MWTLDQTFEMNGISYSTDLETLDLLRSILLDAWESNDFAAVSVVMHMGLRAGRILAA